MDKFSNHVKNMPMVSFGNERLLPERPSTILPLIINYFGGSSAACRFFATLLRGGAVVVRLFAAFHAKLPLHDAISSQSLFYSIFMVFYRYSYYYFWQRASQYHFGFNWLWSFSFSLLVPDLPRYILEIMAKDIFP